MSGTRRKGGIKLSKRPWALLGATVAVALSMGIGPTSAQAAVVRGHDVGTAALMSVAKSSTATPATTLAGGWGYVSDGNLRTNPNLGASKEVTIYNQWVNILCWIDGGPNGYGSNRWFKAQYYSLQGYLSSGVVSHQPIVGRC